MRDQIVEKLAAAIARHTARSIPLAVDLWSVTEIADYLKCTERYVLDNYAARPDFPHGGAAAWEWIPPRTLHGTRKDERNGNPKGKYTGGPGDDMRPGVRERPTDSDHFNARQAARRIPARRTAERWHKRRTQLRMPSGEGAGVDACPHEQDA